MELITLSIFRTAISFMLLILVSLWIGKQVNSHVNHYNFALSITIGAFIANMGFDTYLKFIPMLFSFLTLIFVYFLVSLMSTKSRRFRVWISGKPTVIMEDGKILDQNMRKTRYTIDDLNQQLRELGIFNIFEVEYAVLEVSGNLSVLKKTKYQQVTKNDINPNITNQQRNFPLELIMDGVIIDKNFNSSYSSRWLSKELQTRNLQIEEIQYAVVSSNGSLFIDLFKDHIESPLDKE